MHFPRVVYFPPDTLKSTHTEREPHGSESEACKLANAVLLLVQNLCGFGTSTCLAHPVLNSAIAIV